MLSLSRRRHPSRPESAATRVRCTLVPASSGATPRFVALSAAVASMALAGCGGGSGAAPPPPAAGQAVPVAFTTALIGDSSGITTPETVVLRTAAQWEDLWARHARVMVPLPPAPVHDFSGRQMVGVFVGSRPDGCHAVTVTAVEQQSQSVTVRYRERGGGGSGGQACTQAITQPHHLVWMPASTLPVEFKAD